MTDARLQIVAPLLRQPQMTHPVGYVIKRAGCGFLVGRPLRLEQFELIADQGRKQLRRQHEDQSNDEINNEYRQAAGGLQFAVAEIDWRLNDAYQRRNQIAEED